MSGLFGGNEYEGPSERELSQTRELEEKRIQLAYDTEMAKIQDVNQRERIAQEDKLASDLDSERTNLSKMLIKHTNIAAKEAAQDAKKKKDQQTLLANLEDSDSAKLSLLRNKTSEGKDASFKRKSLLNY